ncbi:MAG TPA: polyphenol oxidase family protein [Planctomycetota bacterium]|nr:polyphenol oxidase family protein [Planctomycetota bacterium]
MSFSDSATRDPPDTTLCGTWTNGGEAFYKEAPRRRQVIEERLRTLTARVLLTDRRLDCRRSENDPKLREALGLTWPVMRAEQVHGGAVRVLDGDPGSAVPGVDGLATRSRLVLLALGADCPGIAIVGRRSVAVAHSGWRGTVADIGVNAVSALVSLGEERAELRAFVGPGIGACCFEVGDEVVEAFERAHGPLGRLLSHKKKAHIDLKGAIERRLREVAGVGSVTVAPECTRCSPTLFSRRRDGPGCGNHAVVAHLL